MVIRFAVLLLPFLLAGACSKASSGEHPPEAGVPAEEGTVKHAAGFQLTDRGSYRLLSIYLPFQPRPDTIRYALVKRGAPTPDGFAPDRIINVPVRRIAVTSSLHAGAVDRLEAWDFLAAVGDGSTLYSPAIRKRVADGSIAEIQKGTVLNQEKVIGLQPDLLMVTGGPDAGMEAYKAITQSGIPVIINSEWMENTPLGRAEWIKVMAALLDRQNLSDHQFAMVESNYTALAGRVRQAGGPKPSVLLGNEFRGTWYMPGGRSFMAYLLEDAGADYHWKNTDRTGSVALSFESVYPVALEAEVWLNISLPSPAAGREEFLASDSRYADFKPVKNGQLYGFHKRTNENGANDYWESASFRPDLLLADYVHILHPEILPEHQLYYCKKLE